MNFINQNNFLKISFPKTLKNFFSFLISFYFILLFLKLFLPNPIQEKILILLTIIALFFSLTIFVRGKINIKISLLVVSLFIMTLLCTIINGRYNLNHLLMMIANFSIVSFLNNYKINYKLLSLTFLGVCIFLFIKLFSGVNPNYMFIGASRNWVSLFLLPLITILYMQFYEQGKRIPLYPAIFLVILCVWARGRSGILTSVIVLLGIIYLKYKKTSLKKGFLTTIIIVIIIFIVYPFIKEKVIDAFNIVSFLSKFEQQGFTDNVRSNLLSTYISNLNNLQNLLFGYNYSHELIYEQWNLNPHNSFIRMHSYLGIGAIFLMVLIIFLLFRYFITNKLYFFLLLALSLRAYTDNFLFVGPLDFTYFIFVFKGLDNIRVSSLNKYLIKYNP